jgi:uncharacterized membrane protein YdbT with pleckstrin-like domain
MAHNVLRTVFHSPLAHWLSYVAAALIMIASFWFHWILLIVGAFIILSVEVARRAERLVFYEDGVSHDFQLVSSSKTFLEYDDIQSFKVTQSVAERILGLGTIHLQTAGEHSAEIVFNGIQDPQGTEEFVRDCLKSVGKKVDAAEIRGTEAQKAASSLVDSDPS